MFIFYNKMSTLRSKSGLLRLARGMCMFATELTSLEGRNSVMRWQTHWWLPTPIASKPFRHPSEVCVIMKTVSSEFLAYCRMNRYIVHACSLQRLRLIERGSSNFIHIRCRRMFSSDNEETGTQSQVKKKHLLGDMLQQRTERLRQTEERIKRTGRTVLKDFKEAKEKMKERMEGIIERENVLTIPNILCVTRMLLTPYVGYLILHTDFDLALGIFAFAGVTDMLDGWIARNFENQSSKMGSFLDPMADKILVGTLFICLTYVGLIPVPLTGLIVARDAVLVAAGFYIRYKSLPAPRTLSRYFDVTHATVQLAPTFVSKVNTAVQLVLLATTLAAPVFSFVDHPALQTMWYVTASTTLISGLSYVFSKNTYHYLKSKKD